MKFRILGPLEVADGDRVIPVLAGKQRVVLAALLLRANHTVSVPELIDRLWENPPADARGTVQKYVMRLRHLLGERGGAVDGAIRTEPDGYRLVVPPGQLDLDRFQELVAAAARAERVGDAVRESALLSEGLALWRGVPPLSDVASERLQQHDVSGLVERYLHALDRRIEVDLAIGRHGELTAELASLVRAYPLRERFWAQRLRALHGAGRQGEALEAYREVARLLADELGVDPGAELRAAHREVLDGDPTQRDGPRRRVTHPAPSRSRPRASFRS